MICKNCGNQIPEGAKFCARCGNPVEPEVIIQPEAIVQPEQPIQPIQPEMAEQPVQPEQPKQKKSKAWVTVLLAVFCGVFLIVAALELLVIRDNISSMNGLGAQLREANETIVAQDSEIKELKQDNLTKESELELQSATIDEQRAQITSLTEDKDFYFDLWYDQNSALSFYENYAGIVSVSGDNYYHVYGCSNWNSSKNFWIYNVDLAKGKGYSACPYCH